MKPFVIELELDPCLPSKHRLVVRIRSKSPCMVIFAAHEVIDHMKKAYGRYPKVLIQP